MVGALWFLTVLARLKILLLLIWWLALLPDRYGGLSQFLKFVCKKYHRHGTAFLCALSHFEKCKHFRSKPAHLAVQSVLQSTISCCVLKRSLVLMLFMLARSSVTHRRDFIGSSDFFNCCPLCGDSLLVV